MGASLALAGLTACTKQPAEKILPYVRQPEDVVPGRPLFFATALGHDGYARGVLVESHEGRPTKVEGNPDHPLSLGATDVFGQAQILGLYDPDRSQTVKFFGEVRTGAQFRQMLGEALAKQKAKKGAGLRFLTGTVASPTLTGQIEAILAEMPAARWHAWEPVGRDNARRGSVLAFGEAVDAQVHLDRADVVLSLEADFVGSGPASLRLIREFAKGRKVEGERAEMNRLYVVEGSPSLTGAVADHALSLRSSEVEGFARAVAAGLGLAVEGATSAHADWVGPLVKDLRKHGARALVLAGESQPPAVHALAHAMNDRLGSSGTAVVYTSPVEAGGQDHAASLRELAADMEAGKVEVLVVLGANPAYAAPADLGFQALLESDKVPLRIHLGLYEDETAERCQWHLPEAHPLEAWSDAPGRRRDGLDRAAADRAALRRAVRPRGAGRVHEPAGPHGPRPRARPLEGEARRSRLREALAARAARRDRGRHRAPRPLRINKDGGLGEGGSAAQRWLPGDRFPARSRRVGRPLRQQRLAAGAAPPAHQADLGQRRDHRPRHRPAPRLLDRGDVAGPRHRGRGAEVRGTERPRPGLGAPRPSRRRR